MGKAGKRRAAFGAAMLMLASLCAMVPGGSIKASAEEKVVKIDAANFPDDMFRAVVSEDHDLNHDGYLDSHEITYARNIHCDKLNISSLKGIEYFTELQGLYCTYNNISKLDLSNNKELRGVWCDDNPLTTLDFSNNPYLLWVYCSDCDMRSINLTKNPDLAYLEINTNPNLKSLNVMNNPELEHLTCGSCGLETLNLRNNKKLMHLDAFRNKFKTIDLSQNTKMKRLDIWDNEELGNVSVSHMKDLQYFNCANNGVTGLDLSQNKELQKLTCNYNPLKKLDLSANTKLTVLLCNNDQLGSLDLSNNKLLRYLYAGYNNFTTINIGNNPALVHLYKTAPKMDEYIHYHDGDDFCGYSWTIDYGGDDSTGNDHLYYMWLAEDVKVTTTATKTVDMTYPEGSISGVDTSALFTRGALVQVLYQMAGKPSVSGLSTRFTDVKGSAYEAAIKWGESKGLCVGYPYAYNNTFGVNEYVSRQDTVFMLMRFSEVMNYERAIDFGRSDEYIDYNTVDYDHWEAVCWSATWQIMEGKQPGKPKSKQYIDPYGKTTRTEFKAMLDRLMEVNEIKRYTLPDIPANPVPTSPTFKYGDVNSDKSVNETDIARLQQYLAGWTVTINRDASDVNIDKKVNEADLARLQQYLADWNVKLGVK